MMINPDHTIVSAIRDRLVIMDGYCPCHPEEYGNEDWKCLCKNMRERQGCCCGLYVRNE